MPHAPWGNQHASRKAELIHLLNMACTCLRYPGTRSMARNYLAEYREAYALVPASTRRRWRCGR